MPSDAQEPTFKGGRRDVFSVFDNGKRQDLTLFANDVQPIQAAEQFVAALLPADKARIGSFSESPSSPDSSGRRGCRTRKRARLDADRRRPRSSKGAALHRPL